MRKKKTFLLISFLLSLFFFSLEEVLAGTGDNVSGWAWSENIGWISFNCNNPETPEPRCAYNYGVNIKEDGVLEGYAWSRGTTDDAGGIGWITFNENQLSGCPPGLCRAWAGEDGKVYGWARAYRAIEPEGQTLGGWTGWIKLRGVWTNPLTGESGPYGVEIDTNNGEFSGWAWGGGGNSKESAVIGWINFEGVKTSFSFAQAPPKPTELSEQFIYCNVKGSCRIILSWKYPEDHPYPQDSYQVLVDDNADFPSPEIDSCDFELSGVDTCQPGCCTASRYGPIPHLDWNTAYYWKVRVKDNQGSWSEYSASKSFNMPRHAYPWVDFDWSPKNPTAEEEITFIDNSKCYSFPGNVEYDCKDGDNISYLWDFGDGQTSPQKGDVTHNYESVKEYTVTLTITDSSLFPEGSCFRKEPLKVFPYLPWWKEILPF